MKKTLAAVLTFSLLLIAPSRLHAKGATVKNTIEGADLAKPVEISDPNILKNFQVWTGPGTSSNEKQGLIIDWAEGTIKELPKELVLYQVSFYVDHQHERIAYVVFYAYDPSTGHGYVYLPGNSDQYAGLNVRTIYHGVEGNWFHAWSVWEDVARPLIERARVATHPV